MIANDTPKVPGQFREKYICLTIFNFSGDPWEEDKRIFAQEEDLLLVENLDLVQEEHLLLVQGEGLRNVQPITHKLLLT